ncbi:MAG TPA: hypothetical protein VHR40_10390 [Thermoleophilaceae bacterium]|nr:hypothetical protein [Thermoleophilaceae bacterium]
MAVILAVLVLLIGLSVATGWDEDAGGSSSASARVAPIGTIEARVERLRGLDFTTRPVPQTVTPAQARREGLADLDRSYPASRRLADEEFLKLLRLIDPRVDLRAASSSIFGEQVAGYYDPRSRRLRVVSGASTSGRVLNELVLSHELTHALEDQRLGLDQERLSTNDDRALAYLSLVEGSATAVMYDYGARYFSSEELLGGVLGSAFQGTGGLPPFVTAQLVFPYQRGLEFVQRLVQVGGGKWSLVDAAHRSHPPVSTEQIMHPDKYLRFEEPERVRLDPGKVLGDGWRRMTAGVMGEWETGQLLSAGGGGAADAAAGWAGDRYELWQRSGAEGCGPPCPERDALILRWRWDTPKDERQFLDALRRWISQGLGAQAAGPDRGTARGGSVAVAQSGDAVTLALAPDADLAARLAGR